MNVFFLDSSTTETNMSDHTSAADKMDSVLSEMSANILNGKHKITSNEPVEGVVNELKNIKIENSFTKQSQPPSPKAQNTNDDNNNHRNSDITVNNTSKHTNNNNNEEQKNVDEEEVGRRKSKRLKKIRIEKKKERKEKARKIKEEIEDKDEEKSLSVFEKKSDDDDLPVISIETIPGLPQFGHIDENIYLFSRNKRNKNKMQCDCTLTREEKHQGLRGCEDGCLNRMLNYECSSNCPVGKRCANKRFQKKEYAKIIPFKTEMKGWGLKALEDIDVNVFIMEYVGEVIDAFDFHDRVDLYAAEKIEHYYFMSLKKDEIIDSTKKGNITRFINHSCEPNCTTQKVCFFFFVALSNIFFMLILFDLKRVREREREREKRGIKTPSKT